MKYKEFPNGFVSWQETHFHVVYAITNEHMKLQPQGEVLKRYESQGRCGLYKLAEELTDEFESKYKDFEWDGEFFDCITAFMKEKLK